MQATCLMALLQPAPEVFDVFDDVLLLCDGKSPVHAQGPHLMCSWLPPGLQPASFSQILTRYRVHTGLARCCR